MKYSIDKEDRYAIFKLNEENLNSLIAPDLKSEFIFLRNEGSPTILDLGGKNMWILGTFHRSLLQIDCGRFCSLLLLGAARSCPKLITISRLEYTDHSTDCKESIEYAMMEDLQNELEGGAETE